ncbi:hypothetical protein ACT18_04085 [Mycolicibacter kumamotonensis]|uniref:Uncharacterized protein n=1 Tax=Mycolicibacter kumamotonensis TaxID=354243 RepID=A0A1B8SJX3_9MYCO|nr:hypothetical protein ACT18_04085 [Mycolicibacter kumamotonensis]
MVNSVLWIPPNRLVTFSLAVTLPRSVAPDPVPLLTSKDCSPSPTWKSGGALNSGVSGVKPSEPSAWTGVKVSWPMVKPSLPVGVVSPGVVSGVPTVGVIPPVSPGDDPVVPASGVAPVLGVIAPVSPSNVGLGAFTSVPRAPVLPSSAVAPGLLASPLAKEVLPTSPTVPAPLSAKATPVGTNVVVSRPAVTPLTDNMIRRFISVRSFRSSMFPAVSSPLNSPGAEVNIVNSPAAPGTAHIAIPTYCVNSIGRQRMSGHPGQ